MSSRPTPAPRLASPRLQAGGAASQLYLCRRLGARPGDMERVRFLGWSKRWDETLPREAVDAGVGKCLLHATPSAAGVKMRMLQDLRAATQQLAEPAVNARRLEIGK